jgi:hypothetical protein
MTAGRDDHDDDDDGARGAEMAPGDMHRTVEGTMDRHHDSCR